MNPNINNKRINRALVLSGGGAKGAYAFGCLKAFKERNLDFDAVSGTSVGGLNALLWSTNSLDEGQRLWDELSFSTVYPVRFLNPQVFPKFIIRILAIVVVFLNLLSETLRGIQHPARVVTAPLLALIGSFPLLILLLFFVSLILLESASGFPHGVWLVPLLFVATLGAISFIVSIFDGFYNGNPATAFGIIVLELIAVMFLGGLPYFFKITIQLQPLVKLILNLIFLIACFVLPIVFPILVLFFSKYFLTKLGTVLDSTPLYKTVVTILSSKTPPIPTFVTTASLYDVYDPDNGNWEPGWSYPTGTMPKKPHYYELKSSKLWAPIYTDITRISLEESALYCTASAALPFGIVPSVKIQDREFVDGGVVDNIPFYPFIEDLPAKEIYIVLLENFKSDEDAQHKSKITLGSWLELERSQRVLNLPKPERRKAEYNKEKVIPYKQMTQFPNVIIFYPQKESLGNFITGTLNFNGDYASKIMEKGYLETLHKLDEMCERNG